MLLAKLAQKAKIRRQILARLSANVGLWLPFLSELHIYLE
jgi:hypothetical protein